MQEIIETISSVFSKLYFQFKKQSDIEVRIEKKIEKPLKPKPKRERKHNVPTKKYYFNEN